eukprot:gene9227-10201_t
MSSRSSGCSYDSKHEKQHRGKLILIRLIVLLSCCGHISVVVAKSLDCPDAGCVHDRMLLLPVAGKQRKRDLLDAPAVDDIDDATGVKIMSDASVVSATANHVATSDPVANSNGMADATTTGGDASGQPAHAARLLRQIQKSAVPPALRFPTNGLSSRLSSSGNSPERFTVVVENRRKRTEKQIDTSQNVVSKHVELSSTMINFPDHKNDRVNNHGKSQVSNSNQSDEISARRNDFPKSHRVSDILHRHPSNVTENAASNSKSKLPTNFVKRLPQALIIGVKKGGTKALLTFLSAHPDIRSCKKEVHFFDKYYDKGMQWYREKMPRSYPHELTIEKSPRYFITGQAPKRIYEMSPNIKLILILRDPTNRAISDYVHMKTRKKRLQINDSLESLVFGINGSQTSMNKTKQQEETTKNRRVVVIDKTSSFIRNSIYSVHLKKWFRYFPRANIHFVNGDTLISSPAEELRKVQQFLHLQPLVDESNFVYNATKRFYCVRKTLHDRQTKAANVVCLGKSKGREHPAVSDSTLNAMRDFYRPYNEELYKQTGVNFGWL